MIILLIRHGKNDVLRDRLAGRTEGVHLNEIGRQQAMALVSRLENVPLHAIFSSPLVRAIETAEPLSQQRDIPIQVIDELIEVDYGTWQGKKYEDLKEDPLWEIVQHKPSEMRFPGGESFLEIQARVMSGLEKVSKQYHDHGQVVACFAHADIIRLALAGILGLHLDLFQRTVIHTASISAVMISDDMPRVIHMNLVDQLVIKHPDQEEKDPTKDDHGSASQGQAIRDQTD